jgi:hypothetical protein
MSNLNGKKKHKFSDKLKVETALQKLGTQKVTLCIFDEKSVLSFLYEMPANTMLIVTHGGRAPDRLGSKIRETVLLAKECGGNITVETEEALPYSSALQGW